MKKLSPIFLAFDLGAESGRAVIGRLEDAKLSLEEVYRFSNNPVHVGENLYWDILSLWREIQNGINIAAIKFDKNITSLGLDTWGVDFGLLAKDDTLLSNPYHYRDKRTNNILDYAFKQINRASIYELTGIQFMQINSLYQLLAMQVSKDPILTVANTFLNIPDLLNFWLTGRKASEFTIATTTQCYDPRKADWSWELLNRFQIPTHLFQSILSPGTVLDVLRPSVAEATGCSSIPVIAPATHDTNSAVAAVPTQDENYIYLSSGTWSLMGIEVDKPVINEQSLVLNFTNEGGVNHKFNLLKSFLGLFLVQKCRQQWERNGKFFSYDELTQMAYEAPAFGPLIIPEDPHLINTTDMQAYIQVYCKETGQNVPQGKGEIVRCALESLALQYRLVIEQLEVLVGRHFTIIHIVGGGSRNWLLNQLTADTTGRPVIAGPVEASAIGNILVQAVALDYIPSISEGRKLVHSSFDFKVYEPNHTEYWEVAFKRFQEIRSLSNELHLV